MVVFIVGDENMFPETPNMTFETPNMTVKCQ